MVMPMMLMIIFSVQGCWKGCRADPIFVYQYDLALLLEDCDDRAIDDLASILHRLKEGRQARRSSVMSV